MAERRQISGGNGEMSADPDSVSRAESCAWSVAATRSISTATTNRARAEAADMRVASKEATARASASPTSVNVSVMRETL